MHGFSLSLCLSFSSFLIFLFLSLSLSLQVIISTLLCLRDWLMSLSADDNNKYSDIVSDEVLQDVFKVIIILHVSPAAAAVCVWSCDYGGCGFLMNM